MLLCLRILLLAALAVCIRAEEKWVRLRSANFEVMTNAGASVGRETLRRFEQIRHVFQNRTQRRDLSPLPIRIFVFNSEEDFKPYQVHAHAAGYYQPGPSRDYIAMQVTGADIYRVIFHEYVHLVFRHAGMPVPVWFNEGTAELYSTTSFQGDEIRIGDLISSHIATLRLDRMLDIGTLMEVDHQSAHYNERGKTGILYAQSWALVHMLNFSPSYQPGLPQFIQILLRGEPHQDAFRRAFGKSEGDVLKDLREYIGRNRFIGLKLRAAKLENIGKVPAEPISRLDAQLSLADLLLAIRKTDEAERIYLSLARDNPASPEVEAALGHLALQRQQDENAVKHLRRAVDLGSRDARVHYDYAMLLRDSEAHAAEVVEHLVEATRLDATMFDAHHYLGYLYLRQQRYGDAIVTLKRAADLQPLRAPVWEYLALAYHFNGDRELALSAARNARRFAATPEEILRMDSVIEMIQKASQATVEARPPLSNKPPVDAAEASATFRGRKSDGRIEGSLVQVDCLNEKARLHIRSGSRHTFLLVRDPGAVLMRNAGGVSTHLACGTPESRLVAIDYITAPDGTYGTAGDVTAIEFR